MLAIQISAWSIGDIAIWIVVVGAVVALAGIALKRYGIQTPDWVVQAFWILVVAAAVIFSIRLILSL